jgi:ribosomal protein L11 methyltransferase
VEDGRKPVLLLPLGTVFGNGYHPSTRMFLDDLEKLVRPGDLVADIGTGSGILAIAAARLGAVVYATDISQRAVDLARKNVKVNRLGSVVEVTRGTLPPKRVDVVLCNLGDQGVGDIFGGLSDLLNPGGLFVLTAREVAVVEAEALVVGLSKIKSLPMGDGISYMVLRKEDG